MTLIKIVLLVFFVFSALGCITTFPSNSTQPSHANGFGKPNIVLIVADDQGYADHGAHKLPDVMTPSIDRLVQQGVLFNQAYATSPICNASRVGLMTGRYQQRQGVYWYGGPGLNDELIPTMAEVLKRYGYVNGYVGKFHYGKTRKGNSARRDFPLNHGFDYFYGFEGGRKHYIHHKAKFEKTFLEIKKQYQQKGQSLAQGPMWLNRELVDQEGFSTELFGEKAIQFIRRNGHKPFFLQLGFNAVHNFTHQLPEAELKQRGLKGYRDWDPAKEDYRSWYVGSRFPNNSEGRAHYLAQLELLDREVGRVIQFLEDANLRQDTLIVYISDNGGSTPIYANNGSLRGSKYTLYEGGIRIPMIVSWPGNIPQGEVRQDMVSTLDILPTLCAYLDECDEVESDGLSLRKTLLGESQVQRDFLVWDTKHEVALRRGNWKLKIAKQSSQSHAKSEMVEIDVGTFLYDLRADPFESKDLSKKYPEKLGELLADYKHWRASMK